MASITLTVPDDLVDEIADAFGFTGFDPNGAPIGKAAHIKGALISFTRDVVVRRRQHNAQQAAASGVVTTVPVT